MEAKTYRHGGHSRADPAKYRPDDEVKAWLARDPIPTYRDRLLASGVDPEAIDRIEREALELVDRATEEAKAGPYPEPEALGDRAVGRRGVRVAELTYREAVSRAIAQEMERDPSVYFIGEDVAAAGGVFKTTEGLFERFGPRRVRDTPISEQAIIGAVMGAAMNGLRPVAELMFSDFFAVCWDLIANQIAKTRYMTNGQVALPLVIRTANGGGVRFGAQHSQSVEGWAMAIPGLKVVVPSNPVDMIGLFAAAVRDPDPVIVVEPKVLYATKGEVPDGEVVDRLGSAKVLRQGSDVTIAALGAMVPQIVGGRGGARGRRDRRRGHRRALARPARRDHDLGVGRQDRTVRHRRGEPAAYAAGAPRSRRSSPRSASSTSTARSCGSRRRTSRSRPRTRSRTSRSPRRPRSPSA